LDTAFVYAGLGDLDRCFESLEKAYAVLSSRLPLFLRGYDQVIDTEQDPRFADLLRRIGLEE
jgi:hypothetical protein